MAPYKILKQGYMSKEPPASKRGLRKKLHRYWFVLVEDKRQVALVYFKNEDSYIARQRNEGFIRLDDCEAISVIGEYLGSKNAFVVKTPRAHYHLVPESRYDLHEWIFTLHNSLEAFKKKQRKAKERQQQGHRPRSNTTDLTSSTRPSNGATGTTPPRTPTRRAPPPPGTGGAVAAANRSPRRRPVRPAPLAPGARNRRSQEPSPTTPPIGHCVVETPPPGYLETQTGGFSQEGYSVSTLESGIHPVMDLDISQTEHEVLPQHHHHHEEPVEVPQPVHIRSVSDSLILHQQNSASLPDLINNEGSSSPDDLTNGEQNSSQEDQQQSQQDASTGPLTFPASPRLRHTRHLSLTGGLGEVKPSRRRKSKRSGSIKQRSRSPPNLPPPPPPGENLETIPSVTDTTQHQEPAQPVPDELAANEASSTSLGFSEVMNTISNIDEQLDMINDGFSPKPNVPVPQRMTEPTSYTFQPISAEMKAADEEVEEREWSTGDHAHPSMERTTPEGASAHHEDLGPSPQLVSDQEFQQISSPGAPETLPKPVKGKHRVMFKEEVEDIPSYESQTNQQFKQEEEEEEEIPSSVAALKKKLFGAHESETARYKKEGILSPRHTHPENVTFSEGYEFHKESSPFYHESSPEAPNVNNNNSQEDEVPAANVQEAEQRKEEEDNVFDASWDQSSKFKVVGVRKQTGKKERTPPPNEAVKSGEVKMSEVPQPGSMELRNVMSLERPPRNKITHSYSLERPVKHESTPPRSISVTADPGDSLLASISSTLQARSRYGSDSFLASVEPLQPARKKATSEVKISTRGELEKIRAAHRRDSGPASGVAASAATSASHTSPPQHSHNHTSPSHRLGASSLNSQPRLAVSMDELQRDTHVTYDANTNSHILRSLV